jgi:hypothetical protein
LAQAYLRLYYQKKLKPIMRRRWNEYIKLNPGKNTKGGGLNFRNAVARELLDTETDEVKAEVAKKCDADDLSDEDIDFDDDSDADEVEQQRRKRAFRYKRKAVFYLFSK